MAADVQRVEHSPLPWIASKRSSVVGSAVMADGVLIAAVPGSAANAEFIVRAVNCHEELLAALKALSCAVADGRECPIDEMVAAQAAIARAEGR